MKRIDFAATFVAFAALAFAASVGAQNTQPTHNPMSSSPDSMSSNASNPRLSAKADASFAQDAATGGQSEVKLGQLAQQKGSNEAVKQFGQKMITDHSAAGDELKTIASKDGITVRMLPTRRDRPSTIACRSYPARTSTAPTPTTWSRTISRILPNSSRKPAAARIPI